ncbi:MAG: VOC family protein [Pseudomonadota bacterium]
MHKVLGFGGFFFRAEDHEGLAAWYRDHLGIDLPPDDAGGSPWIATGGPTVFAPFAQDTEYFAPEAGFMLNFRVANLDAMLAQLDRMGVSTRLLGDFPGIGRFAHLQDPEGNAIELWEPEEAGS